METTTTHTADAKRRNALGKGIESLLGPRPAAVATVAAAGEAVAEATGKPLEVPLDRIDRSPNQTRKVFDEAKLMDLARSIAANGVIQPVTLRAQADGRYLLIAGERRCRASTIAGNATIPAVVQEVSDQQSMEMTIVENLQREDLNPMEHAHAFGRLQREFNLTQEQMSARTGKDRATVGNYVRLLKLPMTVQSMLEAGELSFGHVKVLMALNVDSLIIAGALKVNAQAMSVRQTEQYVQGILNPEPKEAKPAAPPQDANVREAQERLQRRLGLKVQIDDKAGKGRVIIEYSGVEDFDAILGALGE